VKAVPSQLQMPFDLTKTADYLAWRRDKLAQYPSRISELMVDIVDPTALTTSERSAILRILSKTNVALYRVSGKSTTKEEIRQLGLQLGLHRLDGNLCADEDSITSLQVVASGRHRGYIPYTNKPLSWHTDGYYNSLDHQIQAILMHCVTPASIGGENALLDHEILYLLLRDEDPALISALMHPQAMSIPPNMEGGEEIRGETVGPVFSVMPDGHLHMRYSARTRNITWRDDVDTQRAVMRINEILASSSSYIFRYKLKANEGVISNNVLHNRSGFQDEGEVKRLLYRARYYDRIAQT
jgi:alpha-ketoglutarate-dependent taurine dioxygenase